MKHFKRFILLVLLAAILAGFTGCYLFPQEEPILAPPLMRPVEVSYSTTKAHRGDIERRITGFGTFVSIEQQHMFFRHRGGRIKAIHVRLGDDVQIGDLLAELYTDNLESQIKQQRLHLRRAELNFEQVRASGANRQQREMAFIDVELNQIRLDDLLTELEQSRLYADISGRVVYQDSRIGPGDWVGAYQNIIRVADPYSLQLQYTGSHISDFSVGVEVDVKVRNQNYKGIVVSTPGTAPLDGDESLRNVVRIVVEGLPEDVMMGQNADISLIMERSFDTIIVPKQAIRTFMGRRFVNILEDGLNNERDVLIGVETATEVEIVEGVEEGEQIILR